MKYWLDTEFIEDGKTITLLSIGIVAEDGREYYAQQTQSENTYRTASDWVARNVYPHMRHFDMAKFFRSCEPYPAGASVMEITGACEDAIACPWRYIHALRSEIIGFCEPMKYGKPEFWGYYADYDWVAVAQIFGTMMDLPRGWPMYCRDIKQWCDQLGNPRLPEQGKGEHHALADAQWNRSAWYFLQATEDLKRTSREA